MFEFLHRWCKGSSRVRQNPANVRKQQFRPRLEGLEDRLAPAVFNINSTADILNPTAGTVTLRSAIELRPGQQNQITAEAFPGPRMVSVRILYYLRHRFGVV
jgi:hypothetical protein